MSDRVTVRRLATAAGLVFAWCALWVDFSVPNLLSGCLVAGAVAMVGVGPPGRGRVHLAPLIWFAVLAGIDLMRSTASVAWEVLTPTDHTDEAIVALDLPMQTRHHLLLMVVAITVTPGTAVVDADPDTGRLYLHLLHRNREAEVTAHVERLVELACRGLPPADDEARTEGVAA